MITGFLKPTSSDNGRKSRGSDNLGEPRSSSSSSVESERLAHTLHYPSAGFDAEDLFLAGLIPEDLDLDLPAEYLDETSIGIEPARGHPLHKSSFRSPFPSSPPPGFFC